MKKPVRMFIGYTNDANSVSNWSIRVGTGGSYAHALVMFHYEDGSREYYESISKSRKIVSRSGSVYIKNGLGGPFPAGKIIDWAAQKPSKRSCYFQEVLGLTQEEIGACEAFLVRHVPFISYAKGQILQNARYLVTGRLGKVKYISPKKWTCSETAFRCLPDRVRIFCGVDNFCCDWITPSGQRGWGLLSMINRWNESQED